MKNPDDDPRKQPKKTLAERRKEARKAVPLTRQLMEAQAMQRELAIEEEMAKEKEEQELKRKSAQEQHDYDMALAMSSVPTPTENPLLMPHVQDASPEETQPSTSTEQEDSLIEKGTAETQISYILDCPGCGGKFDGTKRLKSHVKERPECLIIWGGEFKTLENKVKAEFKRRKRKLSTPEGKEAERKRKLIAYWDNPQKERDRKSKAYENNKELERARKRKEHNADPDYARLRQSVVRASRVELQTSMTDKQTFEKEGRYGPIFPCVSCWELNWYFSMFIQQDLDILPSDLVDTQHVRDNIALFQKQNRFFICRPCKSDLDKGRCPKMSSKNYLQCPWKDVPSHLLNINTVSISLSNVNKILICVS